jgi:hypothetical protein
MWDPKFINCGVVRVEYNRVRVFKDQYNSITIDVGTPVQMALWSGDILNVYLGNGRVRRYKDRVNYSTMG